MSFVQGGSLEYVTKCDRRGEGFKNCPNLCDVIYECPLRDPLVLPLMRDLKVIMPNSFQEWFASLATWAFCHPVFTLFDNKVNF